MSSYLRRSVGSTTGTWSISAPTKSSAAGYWTSPATSSVGWLARRGGGERRIAMFATLAFVRAGDVDDTFALAAVLVHDHHDLVRKVAGGCCARPASTTDHEPRSSPTEW
jgi:hypothetical protein